MLKKYADIIIDISHEDVDRTFQYSIPDRLQDKIVIGSVVKIPFGKGNNIRTGYVTGITDTPCYEPEKIKEISDITETGIPIEGRLIALAAWIKENYGSTMINALKTVMPVKKTVKSVVIKEVILKADINRIDELTEYYRKKNAKAKIRLISELKDTGKLPMDVVTGRLNISGQTLKSMEAEGVISICVKNSYRNVTGENNVKGKNVALNEQQQNIVNDFKKDIANGMRRTYLLHGITGSGKTEIYVRAIQEIISQGKQAIMLIPEIALTYQTVKYFIGYFGDRVTIINSRLSSGEKYDQFLKAKNGEVDVVIGPRSALFTPFRNLGLIIIDEEHESSYKSDYPPKYHAREVAEKRAELEGASLILGSATPSVESYKKALEGEYVLWQMNSRAGNSSLAECSIVDLREELRRGNRSVISFELENDIRDRLGRHEQIMLFINKRGFNSCVSCRSCGDTIKCPHCDVSLTRHNDRRLMCHYCGYTMDEPSVCPSCSSRLIGGYGTGTQKVEEEIHKLFPEAKTLRMDRDTTAKKNSHEKILEAFGNGDADILIGTQMIVKGHDFSNVTLVGIVLADLTLFESDYRACERTFDLLTQAAGRAGRGKLPGKVVIQTYQPDNYAVVAAANQDYRSFYDCEKAYRSLMKYPPECNMMVMLMVSASEKSLRENIERITLKLKKRFDSDRELRIVGPSVPEISRIKDIFRMVVYIKHSQYNKLVEIKDYIEAYEEKKCLDDSVSIQFDFNPMNMY
ncbi:MAG: primosomal protein N' [Coprococcus sp.]